MVFLLLKILILIYSSHVVFLSINIHRRSLYENDAAVLEETTNEEKTMMINDVDDDDEHPLALHIVHVVDDEYGFHVAISSE